MGITGANFAVAETGTVVLVTNEGNGRMVTSLPRIHVAVMGMEKVIPSMTDLVVFLALLARSATGQKLSSYTTLVRGPRRPGELEGPEEFHLILLDNGRIAPDRGHAPRGALLPPLRRLPERLPGVPPDRRPRLRPHVPGAHRHPPHRDAQGHGVGEGPGARLVAVRRVQGRVPGAHRHPAHAGRAARAASSTSGRAGGRARAVPQARRRLMASPALFRLGARVGRLLQRSVRSASGRLRRLPLFFGRWTATRDLPPVAPRTFTERWDELEHRRGRDHARPSSSGGSAPRCGRRPRLFRRGRPPRARHPAEAAEAVRRADGRALARGARALPAGVRARRPACSTARRRPPRCPRVIRAIAARARRARHRDVGCRGARLRPRAGAHRREGLAVPARRGRGGARPRQRHRERGGAGAPRRDRRGPGARRDGHARPACPAPAGRARPRSCPRPTSRCSGRDALVESLEQVGVLLEALHVDPDALDVGGDDQLHHRAVAHGRHRAHPDPRRPRAQARARGVRGGS